MKQIIKIIRKADIEREYLHKLELELDYLLLTLNDAMKANDENEKKKLKARLKEIQPEIEQLKKGLQKK